MSYRKDIILMKLVYNSKGRWDQVIYNTKGRWKIKQNVYYYLKVNQFSFSNSQTKIELNNEYLRVKER